MEKTRKKSREDKCRQEGHQSANSSFDSKDKLFVLYPDVSDNLHVFSACLSISILTDIIADRDSLEMMNVRHIWSKEEGGNLTEEVGRESREIFERIKEHQEYSCSERHTSYANSIPFPNFIL
jgi:hypothetical protein